ncbi:lysozyme [Marivita sp. S2033]|uniref:lysozyme n=1 Tax=Marivita sp. S2033 TaxID=3373187 RepID=UPI003982596B
MPRITLRPSRILLASFLNAIILVQSASAEGVYETRPDKNASIFLLENYDAMLGGVPPLAARPIPDIAMDLLVTFEGLELRPYNDSAGYCTVGYGHLIAKARCTDENVGGFKNGISPEEARTLLMSDSALAGQAASDLAIVPLTDEQYGALASFVFNLGAGKFASSTLLKLVRAEAHDAAADQFPRWVLARNPNTGKLEKLRGLVARRNCEAALYLHSLESPFDRASCEGAFGIAPDVGPLIDIAVGE